MSLLRVKVLAVFILKEFRKNHDAELLNTVAAQELKLVSYSKRLTEIVIMLYFCINYFTLDCFTYDIGLLQQMKT